MVSEAEPSGFVISSATVIAVSYERVLSSDIISRVAVKSDGDS